MECLYFVGHHCHPCDIEIQGAVLGKDHLHSWCLSVVRHGGKAEPLRRVVADFYPLFHKRFFSRPHRLRSTSQTIDPLCHFSFSLELSSAGVAPLPPSYHKLLSETVMTFAVFPSWIYLLDGDANCMLSVPFGTSDLHFSCWQSGENCQAMVAGAFRLLGYAFWFS